MKIKDENICWFYVVTAFINVYFYRRPTIPYIHFWNIPEVNGRKTTDLSQITGNLYHK
jgi:hypothetical protein